MKKISVTITAHIIARDGQEGWFRTKVKAGHDDM